MNNLHSPTCVYRTCNVFTNCVHFRIESEMSEKAMVNQVIRTKAKELKGKKM